MREMALPEDEMKIFDETLETRLEDTNQQLKKWITAQVETSSRPQYEKSEGISKGKLAIEKKMSDNPLTNVYERMQKNQSSSRVRIAKQVRYKKTTLITKIYAKLGKKRSTSRTKEVLEVEEQIIADRFGDVPE
jgi:hypothetical protein